MKRLIAAAAAVPLILLAAACTSSSSSTARPTSTPSPTSTSGTETLSATDTGKTAAANLNSNSNAPLTFPEGIWSGVVSVTVRPFTLPGGGGNNGNAAATVTFKTPAGNITVHHSANQVPGSSNPNQPPPAKWTKNGNTCYFTATFSKGTGTFVSGTGKFAGAHGTLTYLVTAQGYSKLASGKTTCSFPNMTGVENNGAAIKFVATGPLTVRT